MTTFLNNENDSSQSSEDEQDIPVSFAEINIAQVLDREDDILEQNEEVIQEKNQKVYPSEPFNLEELQISVPNLKYDTDEYFLEIL